ncbi:MAG TPA: hypothetical protein VHJ54_00780 [Solirubrobacterales bacterium]|jgi:hypothetical protein|nr:hypothetical protein [Solirubrobacterales bacterium]
MTQEHTIRVPTRLKRRALGTLAVALTATAFAVPAAASGYSTTGDELAGPTSASTPPAAPESAIVVRRDGSQAVPFVADVSGTSSAAAASSDFDWGDAAIGAGTALGIVALLGATGLAIRNRRRVAPSTG